MIGCASGQDIIDARSNKGPERLRRVHPRIDDAPDTIGKQHTNSAFYKKAFRGEGFAIIDVDEREGSNEHEYLAREVQSVENGIMQQCGPTSVFKKERERQHMHTDNA